MGFNSAFKGLMYVITGSTTVAADQEDTPSASTTVKSTKLSPLTRVRGARPQKPTTSSMQENRLSSVKVAAPSIEHAIESTVEPSLTESEDSSISLPVQSTTETSTDPWYKQTETPVPHTSTVADVSTSSDTEKASGSYTIPPSQIAASVVPLTADSIAAPSTESVGSTTENYEPTSVEAGNTSAGLLQVVRLSTADGFSPSRDAEREGITSTTQSLFQATTTRRENDQQYYDSSSGDDMVTSVSTVSKAEEENKQSAGNGDTEHPQDVHNPGNGDKGAESTGLEGVYSQGDGVEEEDRATHVTHQVVDSESHGNLTAMFDGIGESAPADSDGSQTTVSDLNTGVVAAGATDESDDVPISTST